MKKKKDDVDISCGGCLSVPLLIFLIAAIFSGVEIGDKKWNIDILPPRIWEMKQETPTSPNLELKLEQNEDSTK